MKKHSSDKVSIGDNDLVKVKQMNHVIEVRHSSKVNYKPNIKKLDKNTYVEISTGEIKEFTHSENRQQNYNSLRQTFNRLRDLINNNFKGSSNELHVTLTYKENMKDTVRLYKDFKRFMTRLKRLYKDRSTIDYINVIEPQERGAWHCHCLIRFNDVDKIFLSNNKVRELWEQGKIVSTKSLKNIDNIGAYLSAYLTDIELTDENALSALNADGKLAIKEVEGKKYIKGGRLHMYPSGMNLYRKSKGITVPVEVEMSFGRVKKKVGAATPHFEKSITLEDNDLTITHQYLQYNIKRENTERA
ncbi:helitron helicase-like domain-containing protein [Robertmurraya siralis]|uniref:helitron helicase-like domain-containing protein n=1 Tax=Robertmurraya siralis TaxID=77777 RepID=UPI001F31B87A|nr:helitron helicase-like domain-containing protein [Robertmurraya siralis]